VAQELDGIAAAASAAAIDDDLSVLRKLGEFLRKRAQRDLDGAGQVADRPFVGLAHVEERQPLAAIAFRFEFLDGDGRSEHGGNDNTDAEFQCISWQGTGLFAA
jgi:hypothetical protein